MKLTKFVVLLAGLCGIAAFFLPLAHGRQGSVAIEVSSYDLVRGIDVSREITGRAAEASELAPQAKQAIASVERTLASLRGVLLALHAPAALLVLFGALGLFVGFRRGLGAASAFAGLAGGGAWGYITYQAGRWASLHGDAGLGMAVWLMLGACALGAIAGIVALVRPERAR